MSAPRKLTDEQIQAFRTGMAERNALQRQLDAMLNLAQWAESLHVSERYLRDIAYNRARVTVVVHAESSSQSYRLVSEHS